MEIIIETIIGNIAAIGNREKIAVITGLEGESQENLEGDTKLEE